MMDFWGTPSFDSLYQAFIAGSTGGKIFMMKTLESEDTFLGKGVTIILKKANPYVLALLKEKCLNDADAMIGDIDLLMKLTALNDLQQIEKYNDQRHQNLVEAPKRQRQLFSIMRKHKSLKPLKFRIKLKKKEGK